MIKKVFVGDKPTLNSITPAHEVGYARNETKRNETKRNIIGTENASVNENRTVSPRNAQQNQARVAKKDEFYTQRNDIEKELAYYKQYFKNKIILCNCDDPFESEFFRYFAINFNHLGLKNS